MSHNYSTNGGTTGDNMLSRFETNRFNELFLFEINRNTFDTVSAEILLQKKFSSLLSKENWLNIIAGTDSGLFLRLLIDKPAPNGSFYIFVELPEIIDAIEKNLDITIPDHIFLCKIENWKTQIPKETFDSYFYLSQVSYSVSFGVEDAFYHSYIEFGKELLHQYKHEKWLHHIRFNFKEHQSVIINNIVENYEPAAKYLKNLFPDKTAVLLAGGPSLDEFIPWVKKHRKNLIVVCVSRICQRLLETEITPDIIISIDPFPPNFWVSKEMLAFEKSSLFVNGHHVNPALLGAWSGRKVYIGQRYPWKDADEALNFQHSGPTVTNAALTVAIETGVKQIILLGVDLCYSEEGYTHAQGTIERKAGPRLTFSDMEVTTNCGGTAETRSEYFQSGQMLDKQAEAAGKIGCRIVNPSKNAIQLPNILFLEIESIIPAPLERPAQDIINDLIPIPSQKDRIKNCEKTLKKIKAFQHQLKEVSNLAHEAIKCNQGLFGRNGMTADFSYKTKMDIIENKLSEKYSNASDFIKKFGTDRFIKIIKPNKNHQWADNEIEQAGEIYYQSYIDVSSTLQEIIKKLITKNLMRMEEEKQNSNLDKLLPYWQENLDHFRSHFWCNNHDINNAKCSPETKIQILDYDKIIDNIDKQNDSLDPKLFGYKRINSQELFDGLLRGHQDAKGVYARVTKHFKNRNIAGLKKVVAALNMVENENLIDVKNLANGYLAELSADLDTALEHYQNIKAGAIILDSLKRMLNIYLDKQQFEPATQVLASLAQVSHIYQPLYADLLKITGEYTKSLDVYSAYIEKHPDDLATMMKMGILCREMGADDAAAWAIRYILAKDPDNQAAKTMLMDIERSLVAKPN